jgi:hypothetical protein
MQLLASSLCGTSKVLQGRDLLRPHHDDRKQKQKCTPLYTSKESQLQDRLLHTNLQTKALAKQQAC